MKRTIAAALMLAVSTWGCSMLKSSSPQGGGMGKDEGFKIAKPMGGLKMTQEETRTIKIEVKRGKFFRDDVTLQARGSEGIAVEPKELTIKSSDPAQVTFQVTATKDTPIGEHRVYVKGVPKTGEPTTSEIKVNVVAP